MVRRKPGRLLPLEQSILAAAIELRRIGHGQFHGYAVAKHIQAESDAHSLTSHGTLYKALSRLQRAGLVTSEWEDSEIAAGEDRPRRRLYTITGLGMEVLALAEASKPLPAWVLDGLSPA
jgi:DNA-binding PadR family transcriptional regulator